MASLFEALHQHPAEAESTLATARRILEVCPPSTDFNDNLTSFFAAYDTLTAWHVGHSLSATAIGANLTSALTAWYADYLPLQEGVSDYLEKLHRYYHTISDGSSADPFLNFIAPNRTQGLLRLLSTYETKAANIKAISTLLPPADEWDLSPAAVEGYRQQAEDLANHIANYRAYGVKPCLTRDGVLTRARHAWVINDGYEEQQLQPEEYRHGQVTPIAYIHLAEYDSIHSVRREFRDFGDAGMQSLYVSYDVLMHFNVRPDGKLAAEYSMGLLPLEHQFAAAGRPELFPLFWLTQLMRISDLVIPEYVRQKHQVPAWPKQAIGRKARDRQSREMPQLLPKLWLPRQKALQDVEAMVVGIQQEASDDEAMTERLTRTPPSHIAGHYFKLREGYEAQPEAIAKAIAHLKHPPPPGYSYRVMPGQTEGHEARRRNS